MGKRKYGAEDQVPKKVRKEESKVDSPKEPPSSQKVNSLDNKAFDVKHFRKELAAKKGQTIVLTQFLQVCLNPDSDADYMLEYIKIGGNSHEILHQLGADSKKNITLATPIFHLFHLMILKVQSSQPQMIAITEEACRYFLNNFMPTVEIMISESSGPRHRKVILKLLTAMVTLNPDLGIEILNQAPLTPKHLHYILEKPNYKEKDNVRTAFVHFMTSFLVDGHLPLIKALLEKQGLLTLVIPGLVHDEAEAVLMFLNILKKNVIENSLISKSLKLKTFSHNVLHQIFKIFYWKGPQDSNNDEKTEGRIEIISLITDIVLTLFTSNKLGLYFIDNTLGTTDVNKNVNLYKALLSLKRPWENQHQCEVILQIIYKCPDLHRAVISLIEQSFEPQHSPIWERTIEFIVKLYEKFKPEDMILRLTKMNSIQIANFIRFVTLPIPLLKFIQASLGKTDETVALYCVKVLVKMLNSLKRYIQLLELDTNTAHVVELKNKLEYFCPKHLPATAAIVNLIQEAIQDKVPAKDKSQDYKLPEIGKAEALISLLDLLLLYNEINPGNYESLEGSVSVKDILDYSMNITEGPTSMLKFKVVSLWLTLDSTAVSLQNPMFRQLFHIMLEVYTSDTDDTWIEAKETIYKFFKTTPIFETDENEIHTMLHALRNCKVDATVIADMIEYVLGNFDTLAQLGINQISNEVSIEITEKDIEKLLDDIAEGKSVNENAFLKEDKPSTFITGCAQYILNNKEAKKSLKSFLCLYVSNLLHSNFSPKLTEIMINDIKLDVRNYITGWISEPVPLNGNYVGKDVTFQNISHFILTDDDRAIEDILLFLQVAEADEYTISVSSGPYRVTENVDDSNLMVWSQYLMFCTVRLATMGQLTSNHQEKISRIFECLMQVCKKQHKLHVCRLLLKAFLKNPNVLKIYNPLGRTDESSKIATKFILNIMDKNKEVINYLNTKHQSYRSFQQKIYSEIIKTFSKIKKRKNVDSGFAIENLVTFGVNADETNRVLNTIFKLESADCVRDDKEPGLALEFVTTILSQYSTSANTNLSSNVLKQVLTLYTNLLTDKTINPNLTNLELSLNKYIENKPTQAKNISNEFLSKFFYAAVVRKSTSLLAATIMKLNPKMCDIFKQEISRPDILGLRELTLPLGEATLHHRQFLQENKEFLNAIYSEYKSNIFKFIEKPHKAGQVYIQCYKFIRKLLLECAELSDCEKVFTKSHKFETIEKSHIYLFQATFLRLCCNPDTRKVEYLTNYLTSVLNTLTIGIKESKEPELLIEIASQVHLVVTIANHLHEFRTDEKENFLKLTESAIWQNFCKAVLKASLKLKGEEHTSTNAGPKLLSLLTTLVKLIYGPDHADVVTLFEMSTSHSEFLKVMLSHSSVEIKSRVIEFLFNLIKINNSIIKTQQIPVYLSAYGATRSPCDRLILSILHYYESNCQPVQEYKPYLWGDSAANYYAVRKNRTASLWSQPTPNQIINLFEKETIERTLQHFPVTQKLEYNYELPSAFNEHNSIKSLLKLMNDGESQEHGKAKTKDIESEVLTLIRKVTCESIVTNVKETDIPVISHKEDDETIYDPAFMFPLLSHMLAPGSVASCFKVLRRGLLSVPVMALSSHCPEMRAAAYHVMHRFYMLLETETKHKNDKLILTDFVDTLRISLSSAIHNQEDNEMDLKNPRLPAIDALYLAKALRISTAPFETVFKPVNNFLIAKKDIDLTVVPDFLSLFHDSDVESAERRNWILEVIKDGTKSMSDVSVIFKTMCIKMIMDFYSSVLCDRKGKERILGVVDAVVSIPRACEIMIEGYGLVSWLHAIVRQLNKDDRTLFKGIVKLIKSVLDSAKLSVLSKVLVTAKRNGKSIVDVPEVRVRKDLEHDLIAIVTDMFVIAECFGMDLDEFSVDFPNVKASFK